MWVLMAVLTIGQYDIILRPIYYYDDYDFCRIDKDTLQPYTSVKLTCTSGDRDV